MPHPDENDMWTHVSHALVYDFPHLDPDTITRCDGDRAALVRHLAGRHDLTANEARETLDHWFAYTTKQPKDVSEAA